MPHDNDNNNQLPKYGWNENDPKTNRKLPKPDCFPHKCYNWKAFLRECWAEVSRTDNKRICGFNVSQHCSSSKKWSYKQTSSKQKQSLIVSWPIIGPQWCTTASNAVIFIMDFSVMRLLQLCKACVPQSNAKFQWKQRRKSFPALSNSFHLVLSLHKSSIQL